MINNCYENPFCRTLSEEARSNLCRSCINMHLQPKQELQIKQPPSQIILVCSGVIVSIHHLEDGDSKCVELFQPGSLIGITRSFVNDKGKLDGANVKAISEVTLGLIPTDVFYKLFQYSHEITYAVLANVSNRLHNALWYLDAVKSCISEERIRLLLKYLEKENMDTSFLTHEELALLADINRVTVTRAMKTVTKYPVKID